MNVWSSLITKIQSSYTKYKEAVEDVTDSELKTELVEQVEERFKRCTKLYNNAKHRLSHFTRLRNTLKTQNQNVIGILLMSTRPIAYVKSLVE